ncbi:type IV secretion system protein VirB10 [Sinorhizobium terangae]|uniref:Type IV secretion system protein VirB10 n=1 Tax=Sinorhizobium terangae TaxID=110322 RepID=A0A6N7LDH0_SINTE|nr:type IV secretion system protein VirB10 [Sinorhizobium terangae]MBB4189052.1 type IV secretion system protein VirB10 [Sinorhizobium terangae]MQX15666.1 type IV secretion system protein VirB10 [Sinorhizobium terangae]
MSDNNPQSMHDVDATGSIVSDTPRRRLSGTQKLMVAGLILALSLGLIWLGGHSKEVDGASLPQTTILSANTEPFRPSPIEIAPDPPATQKPAQPTGPASEASQPEGDDGRPEKTPIFAYSSGDQGISRPARRPGIGHEHEDKELDSSLPNGEASVENDLSTRMKPTVLQASRATLLPHPDLMITQGTIIPCILQTAIDTNLAGYVKCVLPQDVRGETGSVVLLDRGTTVVGEVQRGLQQGDARVFVIWNRAVTPDHAVVSLASPGADEVGRSGLPGTVDNHFWARVGGAMLLSAVQGAFQAASGYAGSSGAGTSINSFQGNGEQSANTLLRASINIPPTLKKNQGDAVSIFVARDIDFSDVYELRTPTGATKAGNRKT